MLSSSGLDNVRLWKTYTGAPSLAGDSLKPKERCTAAVIPKPMINDMLMDLPLVKH